jgi:hypothetical protein
MENSGMQSKGVKPGPLCFQMSWHGHSKQNNQLWWRIDQSRLYDPQAQHWSSVFSDVVAWSQQAEQPAKVED